MTLYDHIVPRSACEWGRLTTPWPWLEPWERTNPAMGRVDPGALWAEHQRLRESE
jgi:hypothetical protein